MKIKHFALIASFVFFSFNAQAGLMTSVECTDGGRYAVLMSENLNENESNPMSIVEVLDIDAGPYEVVYRDWYNFEYRVEPIFPGGSDVEMWFYHQAGNIDVDDIVDSDYDGNLIMVAISDEDRSFGSGEISIDMGAVGFLDMMADQCTFTQ